MPFQVTFNTDRTIYGSSVTDYDVAATTSVRNRVITPGGASEVTPPLYADSIFDRQTETESADEFDVDISPPFGVQPTVVSMDESIATIDVSTGVVTRVADGTARISISTPRFKRFVSEVVTYNASTTVDVWNRYLDGATAKHAAANVSSRISGKTPAESMLIHDGTTYQASRWCSDIDLTCITREKPKCTLVTPRHVVMARHYQNAGPISFLAEDGGIFTRTVLRRNNYGASGIPDVTIGLLDSDLPSSISPTLVLPVTYVDFLPLDSANNYKGDAYLLGTDQEEKATVRVLHDVGPSYPTNPCSTRAAQEGTAERDFYETAVDGDSGSPIFFLIDQSGVTKAVLVLTYHTASMGPCYGNLFDEINTRITTIDTDEGISTGYSMTAVDLSDFTDYS